MYSACVRFATQLPNVEPKSELRDSSSEEEDEEGSEEHSESDEVEYSDREESEDGAGSSSDSENGSEEGDSTSGEKDRVEGQVSLEYTNSIRRVAKAWQAAVVKKGYVLQPVAHNLYDQPLYSVSKMLVANDSHPMISCYQKWCSAGFTVYGFEFNPCQLPENAKIAERDCEFLTNPPITHAKLRFPDDEEGIAILRVHGGIRIRGLRECLERMGSAAHEDGEYAYIAIQDRELEESNGSVGTVSSSEKVDSSESENQSDSDDPDEPDSGAEGAGMAGSSELDDSDGANLSEHDDAGGSSGSDDCSEVGDSKPDEGEQVEDSSAAAVLQLPELLHMIIYEVPRKERTSLRRVPKQWQAAVEKIGHVFQPDDIGHGHYHNDPIPLYKSQAIFRSNPIECRYLVSSRSVPHWVSVTKLKENRHQFVTHPPLTELLVRTSGIFDPRILLQVDGGIRLKDLLEFVQTAHRRGGPKFFHACFGGPKYFSLSKPDEESGESSLDEPGDGPGGDESVDTSAPDAPDDESEGRGGLHECEAGGDEPADSSPPDGSSEKGHGDAGADDQEGASSRVLHTNELLHMIISEVPREFRTSMRRVSKN
jgi:hypothetical protein